MYASATGEHKVAVVDMESLKTIAKAGPVHYPDGIAYAPGPKRVFVSDEHGGADAVIDATTNALLTAIPLGGGAGNTVYDSGSGNILVAVGQNAGQYGQPFHATCSHSERRSCYAPRLFPSAER